MASIISCKRRREVLYLAHRESIAAHRGFIAHAMDARWARGGRRSTGAIGAPSAMGKAPALLAIPHPTRARCGSPILRDEVPRGPAGTVFASRGCLAAADAADASEGCELVADDLAELGVVVFADRGIKRCGALSSRL